MKSGIKEAKSYLEERFGKIRQAGDELRFNMEELDRSQLSAINILSTDLNVSIRRSGTGIVVVVY